MAIKLEMLRVFRLVAMHGALSQAAQQLGRTPSAVSMMLSQLEEHLGAPLFETDRKNKLSKLGELVLEEAIRVTDTFDTSISTIDRISNSLAGTVRVAAVPSVAFTLLPEVISAFHAKRPEVRLEISDVDSASVHRRIRRDEADIGIVTAADDTPADSKSLRQDALGIVCSPQGAIARHVQEQNIVPGWEMLALEPLIDNPLCRLVMHPKVIEIRRDCKLQAYNTNALLSFVYEGLGATILPQNALPTPISGLLFLQPQNPTIKRDTRVIFNTERRLSPAAAEFWHALCEAAAQAKKEEPSD